MKKISFVHFSDLHYKDDYTGQHSERLTAETGLDLTEQFCIGLEKIMSDNEDIDFAIISGDLSQHGTAKEYESLKKILDQKLDGIPYYISTGNHDSENFGTLLSDTEEKKSYDYSVINNGLRIISLDSKGGKYETGFLSTSQLEWLKAELASPAPRGNILVFHHTPHTSGEIEYLTYQMENPAELYDVIKDSDIKGIFCGHTHKQFVSQLGDIPCYTVESLSFGIETLDDRMLISNSTGYNRCEIDDEGLKVEHVKIIPEQRHEVTIMYSEF